MTNSIILPVRIKRKGGEGSGNFGHGGLHGVWGGSGEDNGNPLESQLISLRAEIADVAQDVYDDWDPEGGWDPGGGICDVVCTEIQNVIHNKLPVDSRLGGWEGDDHAWLIVYTDDEAYGVDIPPDVYETGGGYNWEKLPDVEIEPSDVVIWEIPRDDIKSEGAKGGEGSGYHAPHRGLPGVHGGSQPRESADVIDFEGLDRKERFDIVKDLKPTDTFRMYHGMSYLDKVYYTAKEGFDPSPEAHERHRIYARGEASHYEGYHVSPDLHVAKGFGCFVFEFVTEAGKMIAPPATHWDTTAEEANEIWSDNFPNSFKPALSASMLLGESQGLLIEPEKRIERIWWWEYGGTEWKPMEPEEFVRKVEAGDFHSYAQPGSDVYNFGQKGGEGSGNWGHQGLDDVWGGSSPKDESIPKEFRGLELETSIDHGPTGWTAGAYDVTRVDKNAIVPISILRDEDRVDTVRYAWKPSSRRPGFIDDLTESINEEGYDVTKPVAVFVEKDGSITISDGTHRIAAAHYAGYNCIVAEVRYFGMSDEKYMLPYLNAGKKSLILPVKISKKGGPGSGNWGHGGLHGVWGGSGEEDGKEPADAAAEVTIKKAKKIEPRITKMVKAVAKKLGGEMTGLKYRLKTVESLARKIRADAEEKGLSVSEAASQINDSIRYTMLFDTDSYVDSVLAAHKEFENQGWVRYDSKWKNYFYPGDAYDGYNTVYVHKVTGIRFEMQYHTYDSIKIKAKSHEYYAKWRVEEDPKKKANLYSSMMNLWVDYPKPEGWQMLPGVAKK